MDINSIANTIAAAAGQSNGGGLYGLLFGKKDVPVKVGLDQTTKSTVITAAGILAGAAIGTALIIYFSRRS